MLPDKIKVGGITYAIERVDEPMEASDEPAAVFYQQQKIKIKKTLAEEVTELYLWHEILHIIFNHIGFYPENDEELVDRISKTLYQVLKDNQINWR